MVGDINRLHTIQENSSYTQWHWLLRFCPLGTTSRLRTLAKSTYPRHSWYTSQSLSRQYRTLRRNWRMMFDLKRFGTVLEYK